MWVLGGVLIILLLAAAGAGAWWMLRPQVMTFDDDSKVTFLRADYGKHHAYPGVSRAINTSNDTLVVWVRQQTDPNQYANFTYYLYDKDGTACVMGSGGYYGGNRGGSHVAGIQFDAFPRRAGKFYVRAQEYSNGGPEMSDQKFVISNPARGSFSAWTAASLPDSEEDGDMTVTLKKLVAGVKMPYNRDGDDDDDAVNHGVQATFNVQINGTNANMWQPVSIETSDATGNEVDGFVNPMQGFNQQQPQVESNDVAFTYQYGLWPDEPAWKLRVEFSKQSGFDDTEQWTLSNIPVVPGRQQDLWGGGRRGQTGTGNVYAEEDLGGLHLKVYEAKFFTNTPPNQNPDGGLWIEVDPALPKGTRLTLVKLTDDQTNDINHWDYGNSGRKGGTIYRYGLQDMDGITNLMLTLAVHKSHFLEFTAKPEMAAADSTDQSNQ